MAVAISLSVEPRRRNSIRAQALFYAVLIAAFELVRGSLALSGGELIAASLLRLDPESGPRRSALRALGRTV